MKHKMWNEDTKFNYQDREREGKKDAINSEVNSDR